MFPLKYRWPVFQLDGSPEGDYRAIIDEEGKVRARTPHVSKFRDYPFDLDDDQRMIRYVELIEEVGRSRAANVSAFFRATFDVWQNFDRSGRERVHVGYSPIIGVDGDKILADFPIRMYSMSFVILGPRTQIRRSARFLYLSRCTCRLGSSISTTRRSTALSTLADSMLCVPRT